jgi:hypothetical protein
MNKDKNKKTWKTKFGTRRVRDDAPTLAEAIAAAQGLSDDLNAQVEIAAALIGMTHSEVRAELLKVAPVSAAAPKTQSVVFTGSAMAPRTIVVERKPSRRLAAAPGSARPVRMPLAGNR